MAMEKMTHDDHENHASDPELDKWVDCLETAALDNNVVSVSLGAPLSMTALSTLTERMPALKDACTALGPAWLGALLTRSRQLWWSGAGLVWRRPPKLRESILSLAEDLAGVPPNYRCASADKAWPPALLVSYAADFTMLQTVGGVFTVVGSHHGCPLYKRFSPSDEMEVFLYYWNDNDSSELSGWWFGPTCGGGNVWLSNRATCSRGPDVAPPQSDWVITETQEVDPRLLVIECLAFADGDTAPVCAVTGEEADSDVDIVAEVVDVSIEAERAGKNLDASACTEPDQLQQSRKSRSLKRCRQEDHESRLANLRSWLLSLDNGVGNMLQYFDVFVTKFDADLVQIAAAKNEASSVDAGVLEDGDQAFWESVGVIKAGHRMLFTRGIGKL
eukprot:TRINITY_DN35659_c0_g2_i1.p1 TRINITY_DN35659_c0_g2~~TRINITY_DN35659_c0_g2_i1.p1  ORF type:complete len:414 (+),score=53.01 TRINITY_DN35659_c0_g2_i1:78-1244(+)